MDQNNNTRGQQGPGDRKSSRNDSMEGQERGTGTQGERNSSGISNRGMSETEEQADLPDRGSRSDDSGDYSGQSER